MSELTTGGINFGYESPVKIIMGQAEQEIKQMQNETKNTIMAEIRQQLEMKDNDEIEKVIDEKVIFCKRCRKFKPMEGSVWDFVYSGFLCDSCYKKLLKLFNKENKQ